MNEFGFWKGLGVLWKNTFLILVVEPLLKTRLRIQVARDVAVVVSGLGVYCVMWIAGFVNPPPHSFMDEVARIWVFLAISLVISLSLTAMCLALVSGLVHTLYFLFPKHMNNVRKELLKLPRYREVREQEEKDLKG